VQIAAAALGLAIDDRSRPLTITGGLTFAGGPGNNYVSHSIATVVGRLRDDPGANGLCTALGWYVTKHAVGLYSGTPPSRRFREIDANEQVAREPPRVATATYKGPATVEAYTVPHRRDGAAEAVIVSALTPAGERALTRSTDPETIDRVVRRDPLGSSVTLPRLE
jgi:acetyl-CoA C-acetyltransferase